MDLMRRMQLRQSQKSISIACTVPICMDLSCGSPRLLYKAASRSAAGTVRVLEPRLRRGVSLRRRIGHAYVCAPYSLGAAAAERTYGTSGQSNNSRFVCRRAWLWSRLAFTVALPSACAATAQKG